MSDAVSALNGQSHTGFATVSEMGLTGMISIRADLGSAEVQGALEGLGLSVPAMRQVMANGARSVAWMSPDELLLFCDYAEATDLVQQLSQALAGEHSMVLNVSDMRACFRINGAASDDVLVKLCPVDFGQLPQMEMRRTRAAQTGVALWRAAPDEIRLICFRSVAGYMMGLLEMSARLGGEITQ